MADIVLASNEASMEAYKMLYHPYEGTYINAGSSLLESIDELNADNHRLHIAAVWIDILRLVSWRHEPTMGDVFVMFRGMGLRSDELLPFKTADINDIFPWLYYGRRFNILRKICMLAKSSSERHIKNKGSAVHCYLISEDVSQVVASSL